MPPRLHALIGAFLAVLAALGVTVALIDSNGDGKPDTVTVHTRNNKVVEAPAPAVDQVADAPDAHTGLGAQVDSTPTADSSSNEANPDGPAINGPVPLAAPHQDGCLTRTIPANWSYRNGTRPSLIVLHYTVSPNRPGWDDVNSIVAFFSRSATQASSNYVIDNEGHCVLMVPESEKAWAQAGLNSATACSIEVVNTGSESSYIGPDGGAGQRMLAKVVHDCAARWSIPLRRGATSGCLVTRAGVVDHATLGACGGGHVDIGKYRGIDIDKTIRNAAGPTYPPITAKQRANCRKLNTIRRAGHGKSKRAKAIRDGEKTHHLRCVNSRPGKLLRR